MPASIRSTIDDFGDYRRSPGLRYIQELRDLQFEAARRPLSARSRHRLAELAAWMSEAVQTGSDATRRIEDLLCIFAQMSHDEQRVFVEALNIDLGHHIDVGGSAGINIDSTVKSKNDSER